MKQPLCELRIHPWVDMPISVTMRLIVDNLETRPTLIGEQGSSDAFLRERRAIADVEKLEFDTSPEELDLLLCTDDLLQEDHSEIEDVDLADENVMREHGFLVGEKATLVSRKMARMLLNSGLGVQALRLEGPPPAFSLASQAPGEGAHVDRLPWEQMAPIVVPVVTAGSMFGVWLVKKVADGAVSVLTEELTKKLSSNLGHATKGAPSPQTLGSLDKIGLVRTAREQLAEAMGKNLTHYETAATLSEGWLQDGYQVAYADGDRCFEVIVQIIGIGYSVIELRSSLLKYYEPRRLVLESINRTTS